MLDHDGHALSDPALNPRRRFGVALTWAAVLVSLVSRAAFAPAQTLPSVALTPGELAVLDQTELGEAFDAAAVDRYRAAHELLEQFFAERSADRRAAIALQLGETGLSVDTIGRLSRIRLRWAALPAGVYYINERIGPHDVVYFLGVPASYRRTAKLPLVVRLPPADPFAAQPGPDQPATARLYTDWIETELRQHDDAIVLMPLMNFDHLFGPGYAGMNAVMQSIFDAAERVNIDPARVYLVGHSLGAHAAWNLALHYPTYFAAFQPLAGAASGEHQRLRLRNLRNTWPVVWHDADDDVVKVDSARQLVRTLRAQKIDVAYEETKKLGHSPPASIVEKLFAKMRSRIRPLYPKEISLQSNRLDADFDRVDWLQIDQPQNIGDDRKMFFSRGTEQMIVQSTTWSVKAVISRPNHIDLTLDNVQLLRLRFNEQMIDFDRAVSIAINGRSAFEGKVHPDLAAMLNDQLALGRGWRYFSVQISIDLSPAARSTTSPATRAEPEIRAAPATRPSSR